MSAKPHRRALLKPNEAGVPYASYAQIVRTLLPLTDEISFYDERGNALWVSDGREDPELRMHVELLLGRCGAESPEETPVDYTLSEHGQPTYVFPIRSPSGALHGAMAVVFRDFPVNATYRRLETVERLLAPLLDILSHGWHAGEPEPPLLQAEAQPAQPPSIGPAAHDPVPLPALLRRTLALATHRLQCAFGAFVMTGRAFTLAHRASPDESDLTMNAAIEAVRGPMMRVMHARRETLIVNGPNTNDSSVPHKFLVFPLRPTSDRLAALLVLFRCKDARDFSSDDVGELTQIVASLSPPVLAELAPEPGVPARMRSASPM